jgi:DNA-binding CsgD family transcriptional regulator
MTAMASTVSARPLRGRERESRSVREVLSTAVAGRGGLVLVNGAAGAGKSRLLTATEDLAVRRGFAVTRIRAEDLAQAGVEPGGHRRQWPRLLSVDDLPGSDNEVGAALSSLLVDRAIVWVVARCNGTVGFDDWLPPGAVLLELGSLPARAVADLAGDILHGRPDDGLLSVADGAAGNPSLLVSLFEGIRDERLATVVQGQVRLVHRQVPRRTEDVVDGWLRTLSAAGRNLLEVASCLERTFTMDTLAALFGGSSARLLAPLEEVVRRDLLLLGLHGAVTFRHELVRQTVLHRVPCAIRTALRDESPCRMGDIANLDDTGWDLLSESERSVVGLVAEGMTNREAAERLFLSPHTVTFHLRMVFRKLGIDSRVELTRIALERDLASDDPDTTFAG